MQSFLNSDVVFIIFDAIVLLLGAYLMFCAFKMKKTDKIPPILLAPKELELCKNPYGFIDYMFPYLLAFGIICVLFGVSSIIGDAFLEFPKMFSAIAVVVLIASWFAFSMMLKKAKAKYM